MSEVLCFRVGELKDSQSQDWRTGNGGLETAAPLQQQGVASGRDFSRFACGVPRLRRIRFAFS